MTRSEERYLWVKGQAGLLNSWQARQGCLPWDRDADGSYLVLAVCLGEIRTGL
jgi:hypothetical protein